MKNHKNHLIVLGATFVFFLVLFMVSSRSDVVETASAEYFTSDVLRRVGYTSTQSLRECSTPKCLTIYLAPWCSVCSASEPLVRKLKPYITSRGVETRIVVGRDTRERVTIFATRFGPETFMDPKGVVPVDGGVPQFIVSDQTGKILKRQPGIYKIVKPPIPDDVLQQYAENLDLF